MTRVKKTRSLKRIHDVKTGSKSKLKKQLGTDRQVGKRVQGRRVLSAYEKFLLENPEAKASAVAAQKKQEEQRKHKQPQKAVANEDDESTQDKPERNKTLLEQLDSSNLKDIY